MTKVTRALLAVAILAVLPGFAAAQDSQPTITLQHFRALDQRGINTFEAPKDDSVAYKGFALQWGAAFTQEFQNLSHTNTAAAVTKTDATGKQYNANQLIEIGAGFNNAVANMYLGAQLAPGIRVALTQYLSSRHHQETWVKDGYMLIDASPINLAPLNELMKYVTLRVGHFEVNYGDAHFRRQDNGNSLQNVFVGNLIMDAFTTEIGAEAYVRKGPFLAMVGTTSGESSGKVMQPTERSMAGTAKIGFDKQVNADLRVRLTASRYSNDKAISAVLYQGDRGGSPYYLVMENVQATTNGNAWSGNLNPGFKNSVDARMLNTFVQFKNVEVFGTYEKSAGKETAEIVNRNASQYAVDGIYRLYGNRLYVAGRYNKANAELKGYSDEVSVTRSQLAGGWFVTPSLLLKGEYVKQDYDKFPTTDIRNGGQFKGVVIQGAVTF